MSKIQTKLSENEIKECLEQIDKYKIQRDGITDSGREYIIKTKNIEEGHLFIKNNREKDIREISLSDILLEDFNLIKQKIISKEKEKSK